MLPSLFVLLRCDKHISSLWVTFAFYYFVRIVSYKHYIVGFYLLIQMETIYAGNIISGFLCLFLFMFTFILQIITHIPHF